MSFLKKEEEEDNDKKTDIRYSLEATEVMINTIGKNKIDFM